MVKKEKYIPNSGDIVLLTFDPQSGHEQKGRRPAVVISDIKFNKKTNFAIFCPITNIDNGFIFHIQLSGTMLKTKGFIMTEHFKSLDYKSRNVKFLEKIDLAQIEQIKKIIRSIVGR